MIHLLNLSLLSKYRQALMGIATIFVLMIHCLDRGVAIPSLLRPIFQLGALGVDIFLLVSGLGLWYSLQSLDAVNSKSGGVISWYSKRYKRILSPYVIIAGASCLWSIIVGGNDVWSSLLEFSTIDFWLHHRGAWYVAMLIPLYAITPLHHTICQRMKYPMIYNLAVIAFLIVISNYRPEVPSGTWANIIENVRHVVYRLPLFFVGYMIAPYVKKGSHVSLLWLVIVPVLLSGVLKVTNFSYWPSWLCLPVVTICGNIFEHSASWLNAVWNFYGKISLESYLFNGVMYGVLLTCLPFQNHESWNYGGFLHYGLVVVVGTVFAYLVNRMCERILKR